MKDVLNHSGNIYNQLEHAYNDQAFNNRNRYRQQQKLYAAIIQQNQLQKLKRQGWKYEIKRLQDDEMLKKFQLQEEKRKLQERKRKQTVDKVRQINQNQTQIIISNSLIADPYKIRKSMEQYNQQEQNKRKKMKQEKLKFINEAYSLQKIRRQKKYYEQKYDSQENHVKLNESLSQAMRHQRQRKIWEQKFLRQPYAPYKHLKQLTKNKKQQELKLEKYLAQEGCNQLQQKMYKINAKKLNRQNVKKKQHTIQLKSQLQNNQKNARLHQEQQIYRDRQKINRRNSQIMEIQKAHEIKKKEQNHQHLLILQSQIKPRQLLAYGQNAKQIGLNSPINIGKIQGDDRNRQISYLQKNLYHELAVSKKM